jgi:hypothetical protein
MPLDPHPIKDILYRTTAKYLTVRPDGILLNRRLFPDVKARILAHGSARTLYRARKPYCRSLDGFRSTDGKQCADCFDLKNCTSQCRVHLLINERPYVLMLAYTSAKNFLLYQGSVAKQGKDVQGVTTQICVIDRGTWGELRFSLTNLKG